MLDTNVVVAAGFNPGSHSARLVAAVRAGDLRMPWCAATAGEIRKTLDRIPRLSWSAVADLFRLEARYAGPLATDHLSIIPDPADRAFAALAEAAGATLISSDRHLLGCRADLPNVVLTPREFWKQKEVVMLPWDVFASEAPDLARRGEALLFQFGPGMAFLATIRKDGAPRLHPLCPVIAKQRLYILISPDSPKRFDLLHDGRYALQAFPPPGDDATGEFYLTGRAALVEDPAVRDQVFRDAKHGTNPAELIFELLIDRAMYTTWEKTADGVQPVRARWRSS